MAPPPCQPGCCTQCWQHAHVNHSFFSDGYVPGPCAGCDNHRLNGCPPNMIMPKPDSIWR